MSKLNKILSGLSILLFIALMAVLYWQKIGFEKPYYAVYLDTGDLYFGQFEWFSGSFLKNVYFLQRNSNDQKNPLSISKFDNAFWGPEDEIKLNEKNIVWKAKLKPDSQIVNYIKNFKNAATNAATSTIP